MTLLLKVAELQTSISVADNSIVPSSRISLEEHASPKMRVRIRRDCFLERESFELWSDWRRHRKKYGEFFRLWRKYCPNDIKRNQDLGHTLLSLLSYEYLRAVLHHIRESDEKDELRYQLPPSWFDEAKSAAVQKIVQQKKTDDPDFKTLYHRDALNLSKRTTWASANHFILDQLRDILEPYLAASTDWSLDLWVELEKTQEGQWSCTAHSEKVFTPSRVAD